MKYIIVGGGLAGLYAAYRLSQKGQDYILLEASDHWGGRASGVNIRKNHQLELGATWFWKDFQPNFQALIEELGLETFDQPVGRFIYEEENNLRIFNRPISQGQRLSAGMPALITALLERLDSTKLHLQTVVHQVVLKGKVLVKTDKGDVIGDRVLLAIPPRIASHSLTFSPSLPKTIQEDWQSQETWMAPHAKLVYLFKTPFWRKQQLTGDGVSEKGLLMEFHDISDKAGSFGAIFGFSAISAEKRETAKAEKLLEAGLQQLEGYFGSKVRTELEGMWLKDWSQDPLVATKADKSAQGHQYRTAKSVVEGPWQYQLRGIASEFSPQFPGYLAGAIDAVDSALATF